MLASSPLQRLRPFSVLSHLRSPRNHYHSYVHPPPPGPFSETESLILSSALARVPHHGFSQSALNLGAKDAGYLDVSTNLFPQGPFSLVLYHLYTQRAALANHTEILEGRDANGKPLGVGAKVKALAWLRLLGNQAIIHRWQDALALMAIPTNVPQSLQELALLADEIWFLARDVSVDASWYTKRASLSTIYAATDLFMTTDKSAEFKDTRDFLERRFEDSRRVGTAIGDLEQWVGFTSGAWINVLRSKGVRI